MISYCYKRPCSLADVANAAKNTGKCRCFTVLNYCNADEYARGTSKVINNPAHLSTI